jgi:hypothetical protein
MRNGPVAAGLLLLLLTTSSLALEDHVKVPFLFSEDEKLAQTELREAIPRSSVLPADQFLNAPMTRLEYMLTRLEAQLNRESWTSIMRDQLAAAFEPSRMKAHEVPISITGFARYSREFGRILVGYEISGLGRPRKPMRTTCDELLDELKRMVPQRNIGFLYHNTALGVLAQEDVSKYTPALETLAKSVVHRVKLESKTEDLRVVHGLGCQRAGEGAPVLYQRFSFKLR